MDHLKQAKDYFFAGLESLNEANYLAAEINFERSLDALPNRVSTLINLTAVKIKLEKFEEAQCLALQSVHLDENNSEGYLNLGLINKEKRLYESAIKYFNRAIDLNPNYADAWLNKGAILHEQKKYDEALVHYDRAISLKADYAEAFYNRGISLADLNRYEDSLLEYERALILNPEYAEALLNKGIALYELKQYKSALASYDQAISIKQNYVEAWSNKGLTLNALGLVGDAIAHYEKAINLDSTYALARWNLSLSQLAIGDLESGLQSYESRWENEKTIEIGGGIRTFPQQLWLGEHSLQGKTILLFAEQGLGDTLQFCRYVSLVAKLGANVILEVQRPLVLLLKCIPGVTKILARGETLPEFDYYCPLLSLPLAFKSTLASIPKFPRYIYPDIKKAADWAEKLEPKTKFRIGIVWSSTSSFKNDHIRSMRLAEFARCLPPDSSKFEIICLQKVVKKEDRDIFNSKNIRYFGDQLSDFSDTAGLIENIDLVISTCTSVPHLSCALGVPTWILLSYMPDWRWLLERKDSPWYPSARLYRQKELGIWDKPLLEVRQDLEKLLLNSQQSQQ